MRRAQTQRHLRLRSTHPTNTYKDSQSSCTRCCNISVDTRVCWDSHSVESLRGTGGSGGGGKPFCFILWPPWDSNGLSIFGLARGIINAFSTCSRELRGDWLCCSNQNANNAIYRVISGEVAEEALINPESCLHLNPDAARCGGSIGEAGRTSAMVSDASSQSLEDSLTLCANQSNPQLLCGNPTNEKRSQLKCHGENKHQKASHCRFKMHYRNQQLINFALLQESL